MAEVNRQKQLTMITDRESELNERRKRMDIDAALAKRSPFTLTDERNRKLPKVEHVTLPKAALFANRANALISGASPQIVIEGDKLDDKKTSKIEEFLEDVYKSIDEYLNQRGMIDLFSFQVSHANLRGGISGRFYLRKEGDKLLPDVIPWDTRYTASELEGDGQGWASYLTTRTKAQIEKEYAKTISAKTGKIRDLWTPEEEVIFLDNKHLTSNENPWGFVPVVEQLSPAGLYFMDEDQLKNSGESIFWLGRDLFPLMNKCASIIATLNMEALGPGYQRVVSDLQTEKPPDYPGEFRSVVDTIAKLELIPKRDLMNSTRMFWAVADSMLQQCTFATTEFGTLQFPLSAIALEGLAEGRHLILLPSLQTLAMWYRGGGRMIIKQFKKLGESASFGGEGNQKTYAPKDLEGDFSISYKYFQSSKRDKLARLSEAQASLQLPVSDDYRLREILEVENPEGELIKARAEQAEKLDPAILLYRQLHSLIDEDKQIEAQLVFRKLKRLLRGQETISPPLPAKAPAGAPGMPLLGKETVGGGGGVRRGPEEVEGERELKEAEREVAS